MLCKEKKIFDNKYVELSKFITYLSKFSVIILVIISMYCEVSMASNQAYVKKEKAIIYADLLKESPIGYIKQGKKITVGEVKRRSGTLLPIIVAGKVAYIETSDIEILDSEKDLTRGIREHQVYNTETGEFEDSLFKNNFLNLTYGQYSHGDGWGTINNSETTAQNVELFIEHRHPKFKTSFAIGFGQSSVSGDNLSYSLTPITLRSEYSLFKTKVFTLDGIAGIGYAPKLEVRLENTNETNKFTSWHWEAGGQVKVMPLSKIGLKVGAYYRIYNPDNPIPLTTIQENTAISRIQTLNMFVTLSYKL